MGPRKKLNRMVLRNTKIDRPIVLNRRMVLRKDEMNLPKEFNKRILLRKSDDQSKELNGHMVLKKNDVEAPKNLSNRMILRKNVIDLPKELNERVQKNTQDKKTGITKELPALACDDILLNSEDKKPGITKEHPALVLDYTLLHSLPAMEFHPLLLPVDLSSFHMENFHRPPFTIYSKGNISLQGKHQVSSLSEHIQKKNKEWRERLKECSESQPILNCLEDISGKDGELILLEYSEEYPSLLMNVGMATKIKNYYRKKSWKDPDGISYPYGEPVIMTASLFLGSLGRGESLQVLENNLFRAPIFSHFVPETDFLIIRSMHRYYIREVRTIFAVGQLCPKAQVPYPMSKTTYTFFKDLMQVVLFQLFKRSSHTPARLTVKELQRNIPHVKDKILKKHLSFIATYQKGDPKSNRENCWILKPDVKIPSEEALRKMILLEDYCCYMNMLAADYRLKNFNNSLLNRLRAGQPSDNHSKQAKLYKESRNSPWNTTKVFLSAIQGHCQLEIYGDADPTGCGEAFSYTVKTKCSKHSSKVFKYSEVNLNDLSDEDLRDVLRELFGEPQKEVEQLMRAELLEVLKLLLTGETYGREMVNKFIWEKKTSWQPEEYKKECQKLFDLQNRKLASEELLPSSESSDEEIDTSIKPPVLKCGQILKIHRIFMDKNGQKYSRLETVRDHRVIEAYVKYKKDLTPRENNKDGFWDEERIREMQREKRRIQEKLRRIKKTLEKMDRPIEKENKNKKEFKMKCGACGATGHMKTNKHCPIYPNKEPPLGPQIVAMTEEDQEEEERQMKMQFEGDVIIDGTKITVPKILIKQADEIRRKSLVLKIPRIVMDEPCVKRKRSAGTKVHCDYLQRLNKTVSRRRADPVVAISIVFEEILNQLRDMPESTAFLLPVSLKSAPTYHLVVKTPMDLQTMRQKLRDNCYKSCQDFLVDVKQIVENSCCFNGPDNCITQAAHKLLECCEKELLKKKTCLEALELAINPLLDSAQASLKFILETILELRLLTIPEVTCFVSAVSKKMYPDYYLIVRTPMNLDLIYKKLQNLEYSTKDDFFSDIKLILGNCSLYNGEDSPFTDKAKELYKTCKVLLSEEHWEKYKSFIRRADKEGLMAYIQKIAIASCDESYDFLQNRLINADNKLDCASKTLIEHSVSANQNERLMANFISNKTLEISDPDSEKTFLNFDKIGAKTNTLYSFRDLINPSHQNKKDDFLNNNHELPGSKNCLNPFVKLEYIKAQDINDILKKPPSCSKIGELCRHSTIYRHGKEINYKLRRQSSCSETSVGILSDHLDITNPSESRKLEELTAPLTYSVSSDEACDNFINDLACRSQKHKKRNKWGNMDIGLQLLKELRRAEKQAKRYRLSNFILEEFHQTLQGVINKLNTLSLTDPDIYSRLKRTRQSIANYLANIVPTARNQDLSHHGAHKLSVNNNIASFLLANQKFEFTKIDMLKTNCSKKCTKDVLSVPIEPSQALNVSKGCSYKSNSALSNYSDDKNYVQNTTKNRVTNLLHSLENSEKLQMEKSKACNRNLEEAAKIVPKASVTELKDGSIESVKKRNVITKNKMEISKSADSLDILQERVICGQHLKLPSWELSNQQTENFSESSIEENVSPVNRLSVSECGTNVEAESSDQKVYIEKLTMTSLPRNLKINSIACFSDVQTIVKKEPSPSSIQKTKREKPEKNTEQKLKKISSIKELRVGRNSKQKFKSESLKTYNFRAKPGVRQLSDVTLTKRLIV